MWTAATEGASIFEIAEHCNREQFNELIDDYAGMRESAGSASIVGLRAVSS